MESVGLQLLRDSHLHDQEFKRGLVEGPWPIAQLEWDEWEKVQTLSYKQMWAIIFVSNDEGLSASQLATKVGSAATSFTPVLDKTEDFVERRPHPTDRRAVKIYLTPFGRKVVSLLETIVSTVDTRYINAKRQLAKAQK